MVTVVKTFLCFNRICNSLVGECLPSVGRPEMFIGGMTSSSHSNSQHVPGTRVMLTHGGGRHLILRHLVIGSQNMGT